MQRDWKSGDARRGAQEGSVGVREAALNSLVGLTIANRLLWNKLESKLRVRHWSVACIIR
jgi:hypothetical protein